MSIFSTTTMAPPDPILGITDTFKADTRPNKANLGVGIYQDDTGKLPLLDSVREAEQRIAAHPVPRPYLSIDGNADYDALTADFLLGAGHPALTAGVTVTVQTLGGSGALKVGGDLLTGLGAKSVMVSDPTWDNHIPIFAGAGLQIGTYRYYDAAHRAIDFQGMLDDLSAAPAGTVVLLHGCCHNPTGYDLTTAQFAQVLDVLADRSLLPFVDLAYQGFAVDTDADAWVVRELARRGMAGLVSNSFSKIFGLYGERVGGLTLICHDADEAGRVRSQAKLKVRSNYSNPPTHGAAIVGIVLQDAALRAQWAGEVAAMRDRIKAMRVALVEGLKAAGVTDDVSYITDQRGMFSYSGLNREQMQRLADEFGVYGVQNGRLCVAALNTGNVGFVAEAMAAVMKG